MISEDNYNLRPIWDATLEVYREIVKICDRHDLRYYVTDGTLIGAVRHKGFIPWDDDFDMSMPRPDYEKFIEYAKTELPVHLKFVNWRNTPEFHLLFGKVQECRREVVCDLEKRSGLKMSNGLFVDIFPIEGYPKGRLGRACINILNFILTQDMNFRFMKWRDRSWKGRFLHPLGALMALLMPHLRKYSDFLSIYEKLLSNSEEAKARNARMIALTNSVDPKLDDLFETIIRVPDVQEFLSPIIAVIPLQLIAYYIAEFLGKDVDQPRNLAKSVTVE